MRVPPHRVLLVDADDTSANAIASALERRGLSVGVARSVEHGLARESEPRALVAQAEALGEHGAEALLDPRRRPGPPPLIVLMRHAEPASLRRAVRLSAADLLVQPVDPDELAAAIEEAIRRAPPSAPAGSRMRRTFPARLESVDRAARELAAFALRGAVGPACRARLASASAEIVHNACLHAHTHRDGRVELEATLGAREIVVTVRDNGDGFDASLALSAALEQGFRSGLGRAACLAESIDVTSSPGSGTCVVLRFDALRADFDDPRQLDLSELDYLLPEPALEVLRAIEAGNGDALVLSPALAVLVGRMLAGPDPRRALAMALWST